MAANTKPRFPASLKSVLTRITSANGVDFVTICEAGPEGTRVDAIYAISTSASSRTIELYQSDGVGNFYLGGVTVFPNESVELLRSILSSVIDNTGGKYLPAGHSLKVRLSSTLGLGEVIIVMVDGGDY